MHVLLVQFDIIWEDKAANHEIIGAMLHDAAPEPGSFILLPELGDTGFSFNLGAIVDDQTIPWARSLARTHRSWIQTGFAERGDDAKGRNCAAIIDPNGAIRGIYRKIHPFSYGRESEFFSGGTHLTFIDCDGIQVAPMICYDLRFPELWRLAALAGTEVFMIGASWPAARQSHWRALLIARAIENQAYVVAVNRIGNDPHLAYAGGSIIVSPRGEVMTEANDRPIVLRATLNLRELRAWRSEFPALRDIQRHLLGTAPIESSGR